MIFGNKTEFAIEAIVEPNLKVPSSIWGRLCIWISNVSIGDIEEFHCGLGAVHELFISKCTELNQLWSDDFMNLSDREIWNLLDGMLYGYHGNIEIEDKRSLEQSNSDAELYSKYDFLTNWGEMFDRDGKSFLLKLPSGALKVLNYDYHNDEVKTYFCSEFEFRRAVKEFSSWFITQENHLSGKNA
jgi:hypothetical protein